jgi:hypothetical protein
MKWTFDANQYDANKTFELIPVGDHRVRIETVEEQISKNTGYEMFKLTLSASGYGSKLFHYVIFMPDRPEITNQNLGTIFDSFGIQQGNMNIYEWQGKVGAARVKHEQYDGKPQAKIAYFLLRSKQDDLPPWQEKGDKNFTSVREEEEVNVPF